MVKITIETFRNAAHVAMKGTLGFKDLDRFQKVLSLTRNHKLRTIILNLRGMHHLNDEGIGLLMLLRLRGKINKQHVGFCAAEGEVKKKFEEHQMKEECRNIASSDVDEHHAA